MKQKRLLRIMSFVLAFIMLLEIGPIHVFATEKPPEEEVPEIPLPEITAPEPVTEMPEVYIEGEVQELRNEYEKHYRLTDGSFMAVQYQVPVHYEDDGQWVDIDNTLQPVTMFSGDTVYQTVNGENVQAFASDLSNGTIMTMATDDHMISMSIWTYDSVEEAAIEDESEDSVVAEDDTVETEPAATQESVPEEPVDSAEASEVSNPDNNLVSDLAFVEEEDSEMSMLSVDETEIVQEDATIEEQQDDTIVAQILTEEVDEDPVADTEEAEHWELDDVMPDALRSSILYEDVFPGVDLRYDTFSYNVKESIILKQPMDLGEYAYSFLLTLDGLEPELQEDGSILLFDDAYEVQYTIPAPYMWDAANVYSDAVFYELEEADEGWVLTVFADENWLEDDERAYPVTIDPSINTYKGNMLFSTAVSKGNPTSSSTFARRGNASVGAYADYGDMEGYIKIQNLPELPTGSIITEAKLYPGNFAKTYISVEFRVDISTLTSGLDDSEWKGIVGWNFRPAKETMPMDYVMIDHNLENYIEPSSWDITPAMMKWYNNSTTNHGLCLEATLSSNNPSSCVRLNAENVHISIVYRNIVGTESYYTYETQSASRAGTGYVGDFTSDLTVFKSNLSYSSTTIPFSLSQVFNSVFAGKEISAFDFDDTYAADYSHMKFGNGWQLSVQESVFFRNYGDDGDLVYRDSDGTLHYFKWDPNTNATYIDEDGLGLKIVRYAAGPEHTYRLEDQTGNIKFFYHNMLSYIADSNDNRIYFLYNNHSYSSDSTNWHPTGTDDKLTQIVAVNKGQDEEVICTLAYNSSNQLSKITDYAERETLFTYTNGNLTKVTHPDGTAAHYAYDSNGQLIRMYDDEANYGIEYEYNADGVSAIDEYTAASINGTQTVGVQIQRKKNGMQETQYRYNGDDREFNRPDCISTDDIVNCYYFDYAGRTINAVTLNYDDTKILGVTAAAYTDTEDASDNKIEKTGQSGQNGVNLLSAGGLETHDGYAPSDSDWEKTFTADHCAATIKDNEVARTGVGSLKTWMNYNAANNATREEENDTKRVAIHQNVQLEGGKTYTVSAYVNTQGIQSFDRYGGSYVAIMNSNNEVLSVGNKVSHVTSSQIENGWLRVYATFDCEVDGEYRIAAVQDNGYGHSYFDDLQLEEGNVPSSVNLLQNGSFSEGKSEWSAGSFTTAAGELHHNDVLTVAGEPDKNYRLSQVIPIGGSCVDQTFLLSGWGKAASAADCKRDLGWYYSRHIEETNDERYYGLIAQLHYRDANNGTHSQYFYAPFNDDYDEWQFASCVIVPDIDKQRVNMTLESIEVYAVYDNNFNTMDVDNLSLRQEPCTTYTYNVAGNVTAVNATGSASQAVRYVGETDTTPSTDPRPATVWKSKSEVYYYQYKDSNKYLPEYISNAESLVYTYYDYDIFGNTTDTEVGQFEVVDGKTRPSSYRKIKTSAQYSSDGSLLKWQENGNGQRTTYTYTKYRDVGMTTDAKNNSVVSLENDMNDRPRMSYINGKISVAYTYDRGLLTKIDRGFYLGNDPAPVKQYYNMSYDSFGNMEQVSIGADPDTARVLVNYSYGENNNHLDSMTYGNGDRIEYLYDELDRVEFEIYKDSTGTVTKKYQYVYNAEGALAKKLDVTYEDAVDNGTADTVNYEYDSLGRLIHSNMVDANGISMLTEHLYDRQNRIEEQAWQLRNTDGSYTTYMEEYQYRGSDGSIKKMVPAIGNSVDFGYDKIARLSNWSNDVYSRTYNYKNIESDRTTTQIASIAYAADGTSFAPFTLNYTYDLVGNISAISSTQLSSQNTSYEYDEQGQMVVENINGNSYEYVYDDGGNLREVLQVNGDVKTPIHTYTYGDSQWVDLLTAYDSQSITYDEIGNPTSYYNGTRWDFNWAQGRQLTTASRNGKIIDYTYDMAGIRDSKTVKTLNNNQVTDTVTYKYLTLSGKVMRQTWKVKDEEGEKEYVINFAYDNSGNPYAFAYEGTTYYYVLNQQGDVIRIVDANGVTKAQYQYNAWGKILSATGDMADINPLRYRGYYYDTETGFYYLQSRYYDPTIGRFINADVFTSTGQGFIGSNMFAYCLNNPVTNADETGCSPWGALSLWDYWAIHTEVQLACLALHGFDMEVSVRNPAGKRGRLDLYDFKNNTYYEVKSERASKNPNTSLQMLRYDTSMITAKRYKDHNIPQPPSRGTKYVSGTIVYGIYDVSYELREPGLIVYTPYVNWTRVAIYALAVATVATVGEAAPVTLPVIGGLTPMPIG